MISTIKELFELMEDYFAIKEIKETTELEKDLAFDEFDKIELVFFLEETFEEKNLIIPDEDMEKWITIQDILDYLKTQEINLN